MTVPPDWDPVFAGDGDDPRRAFDRMRGRCPVARDSAGTWTLFRHGDVVRAALDPSTFPSGASRYLSVPNGMNGEEHARFRALIDRYFTPAALSPLEPGFRRIAGSLIGSLPAGRPVEAVSRIGARFAVRAQSAWLGWPPDLEATLLAWMDENREASRSREPARTAAVAESFDRIVHSQVEARRAAGNDAPEDVTTALIRERIGGRPLTDPEIVSILRNWTAGDLGSIAACVGVIVHRLASDRELQGRWREGNPPVAELEAGIDEILRADNPFTFNRRVTAREVEVGGRRIPAGAQVMLNWTAANRDPEVFGDPDRFRPRENRSRNLVYGIGEHVCPGRGLATMELRVAVSELLAATREISLDPASSPTRETWPYGGYRTVPVILSRH